MLSIKTSHAAPPLPQSPIGRQFYAWLQVFNSGDAVAISRFRAETQPNAKAPVDAVLQLRRNSGGYAVDEVDAEHSTDTTLSAVVHELDGENFLRVTITVDPEEPHHIVSIILGIIPRPADILGPRKLDDRALISAVREKLDAKAKADQFSGTVLLAKNGKPIFTAAYGDADRERKTPVRLDTKFRIGSMNKMFTEVVIAQLAHNGKLNFSDPIAKYLPDYPNHDLALHVTIDMLLTHTGGTGDIFGPEFDAHRLELQRLADYVALYGGRASSFEPGSRVEYSNYGFLLLGALIEKISGEDYYTYVEKHIFQPAGMKDTASLPESVPVSNCSVGYMWSDTGLVSNVETLPYRGTSAGGGYSTVFDLLKFASALESGRLLNAAYTRLITMGKASISGHEYSYDLAHTTDDGVAYFGHGGGAPGMNGDLKVFPASHYTVVVLSNLDPPAARRISNFISNRLEF